MPSWPDDAYTNAFPSLLNDALMVVPLLLNFPGDVISSVASLYFFRMSAPARTVMRANVSLLAGILSFKIVRERSPALGSSLEISGGVRSFVLEQPAAQIKTTSIIKYFVFFF